MELHELIDDLKRPGGIDEVVRYLPDMEYQELTELVGQLVELLNLGESALECVAQLRDELVIRGDYQTNQEGNLVVDDLLEHDLAPWNQP